MLRRLSKIFGLLIIAFFLLVAGVLGKAHWQIRQVQTPLPLISEIRAMLSKKDLPTGISVINTGTQVIPGTGVLAYTTFALSWPDGRIFMIDVGMEPEGAMKFGRTIELIVGAEPVTPHGSVGDQLGAAVTDVAGVAFTHLHEDHTSGLNSLCSGDGKSISLFQTPLQMDVQNHTTAIGDDIIEQTACVRRYRLGGNDGLYTMSGFPGLVAFSAGGHTPGSTVFFAQVHDRLWVIAGDITNAKSSIVSNTPKPFIYSALITPEATGRLEELRLWLAKLDTGPTTTVLVSHDLQSLIDSSVPITEGTYSR